MPKPWKEVEANPQYQALSEDQKQAARDEYFESVVKPQISDPGQVEAIRGQFMQRAGVSGKPSVADAGIAMAKNAGQGALYGTGIGGALRQGKYLLGAEQRPAGLAGAAEAAGDIGGAVLAPVAGLRGMATGALAGAGLNVSGIPEVIQRAEQRHEQEAIKWPDVAAKGQPWYKNVAAKAGVAPALNVLGASKRAAEGALAETASGLLAGGAAGKVVKPVVNAPVPRGTQLLEQYGGEPPVSAYTTGPVSRHLAKGVERWSATNPLLQGVVEPQGVKNIEAVQKYRQEQTPGVVGAEAGEAATKLVGDTYDQAQAKYQAALAPVRDIKGGAAYAPAAAKGLRDIIRQAQATPEDIPQESVNLINETAKKLEKPGLTPGQYDVIIKEFNRKSKDAKSTPGAAGTATTIDHFQGLANDVLKNAHYEGLNQIKPGLGDQLKATNFDYAQQKGDLFGPFGQWSKGKVEDLPKKILASGTEFRDTARKYMDDQAYSAMQDIAEGELINQASDKAGVINLKKLESLYGRKYKDFDWRPDQAEHIESIISMMKQAGLQDLDITNPSGTARQSAEIGHIQHLLRPAGAAAAAAAWPIEASYLKYGPKVMRGLYSNPTMTPQQASVARALGGGLSAQNQLGGK